MKQMNQKLYFGLIGVMMTVLFLCTQAIAVEIEKYDPKLEGVFGIVTKMSGQKITLNDSKGKKIKVKVKDPDMLQVVHFKVGDRVHIQNGELKKVVRSRKKTLVPGGQKKQESVPAPEEQTGAQ